MKKLILLALTIFVSLNSPLPICAKNKASQTEQHVSYEEDNAPVETIYVNETSCNVQHGASTSQMLKTAGIAVGAATLATAGIILAGCGTIVCIRLATR